MGSQKFALVAMSLSVFAVGACLRVPPPQQPLPGPSQPPPLPGPPLQTTHAVLIAPALEPSGFGLYSYILLGSPPSPARRAAYLRMFESVLTMTPPLASVTTARPVSALNLTLLLVRRPGQTRVTESAEWVLDHYDYGRSGGLLAKLTSRPLTAGPYLCSTLQPILDDRVVVDHFLFQDLTIVPDEVIPGYVDAFKRQAAKPDFWRADMMEKFALDLRTTIAIAARAVEPLQTALQTIGWKPTDK
jgi:hypothetical protein